MEKIIVTTTVNIEVPDYVTVKEVQDTVHNVLEKNLTWTLVNTRRIGFQDAANILTSISKRNFSRQGVRQLWMRRKDNGFPEQRTWVNDTGKEELFFDEQDIRIWWRNRNRK